jgi:hypothetical protein
MAQPIMRSPATIISFIFFCLAGWKSTKGKCDGEGSQEEEQEQEE